MAGSSLRQLNSTHKGSLNPLSLWTLVRDIFAQVHLALFSSLASDCTESLRRRFDRLARTSIVVILRSHQHRRRHRDDRDIRVWLELTGLGRVVDVAHPAHRREIPLVPPLPSLLFQFRRGLHDHRQMSDRTQKTKREEREAHLVFGILGAERIDHRLDLGHVRRWFQHVLDLGGERRVDQITKSGNRDFAVRYDPESQERFPYVLGAQGRRGRQGRKGRKGEKREELCLPTATMMITHNAWIVRIRFFHKFRWRSISMLISAFFQSTSASQPGGSGSLGLLKWP